jgi:hypothetical protein
MPTPQRYDVIADKLLMRQRCPAVTKWRQGHGVLVACPALTPNENVSPRDSGCDKHNNESWCFQVKPIEAVVFGYSNQWVDICHPD